MGCRLPYVQYYIPYYGGVIEISSIPLVLYKTLQPEHLGELAKTHRWVAALEKFSAILFVVTFLLVREIAFPVVTLFYLLPGDRSSRCGAVFSRVSHATMTSPPCPCRVGADPFWPGAGSARPDSARGGWQLRAPS